MSPSTFGERFQFARIIQAMRGKSETDGEFAAAIEVGSSSITSYKTALEAPPAARTVVIAKRCGVDPGWLAFGERSGAPSPSGFQDWLEERRQAAAESAESAAAKEPPPQPAETKTALPGGAVFEGDYVVPADRPSAKKRKKSG